MDLDAMDLDAATDELYAISPDDFVERRKALAAAARHEGNRELAKQITQLRRPTRSAWLVNTLTRTAADEIAALLDLGKELAQAQQRGSGPDLRRLSQQRRKTVDALAGRAVQLGREQGYPAPDGAIQEVAQTLQAALGEPDVADLVRRGRLTQATTYGGFGPSDLTAALAASMPGAAGMPGPPAAEPEAEEPPPTELSEHDRRRRELAEQAADQTRAAAEKAQAELRQAESDSEAATAQADELAEEVDTLRSRLRDTETAEREARERARALRRRQTELRQVAAAAEQAARAAAAELAELAELAD